MHCLNNAEKKLDFLLSKNHSNFLFHLHDAHSCTPLISKSTVTQVPRHITHTAADVGFGFKCVGLPLPSFFWHITGKQCLLFGQVPFNLIQLLMEVLAGDLHQLYFVSTLWRKARRHFT